MTLDRPFIQLDDVTKHDARATVAALRELARREPDFSWPPGALAVWKALNAAGKSQASE